MPFKDGPTIIARIPPDASLWASEFLSAWVGARGFIKAVPLRGASDFSRALFTPDYILLTKDFVLIADPDFRARIAAFIRQEGYHKVVEDPSIFLLRHPRAPLSVHGEGPPVATLPPPKKGVDFAVQVSRRQ